MAGTVLVYKNVNGAIMGCCNERDCWPEQLDGLACPAHGGVGLQESLAERKLRKCRRPEGFQLAGPEDSAQHDIIVPAYQ